MQKLKKRKIALYCPQLFWTWWPLRGEFIKYINFWKILRYKNTSKKRDIARKTLHNIKDFSSKCDQIRSFLATFTGEILNGKLHFLCSVHDHRKAYWHIAWSWWSHEKLEEYTFIKFVHIQLIAWLWLFALEKLSVFNRNAGKCGKNADQNNSEYGLFLRSIHIFWSN